MGLVLAPFLDEPIVSGESRKGDLSGSVNAGTSIRREVARFLGGRCEHERGDKAVEPGRQVVHDYAVLQEDELFRIEIRVAEI